VKATTRNEEETERFGEEVAGKLSDSDVLYLIGTLGAGKTCFVRGLAKGLGAREREVASPTFALLHEYESPEGRIVLRHLDLYRLSDEARELEIFGPAEAFAGAPTVVEWPGQAIRSVLPPTLELTIEVSPDGSRVLEVKSCAR
jgi:tRNA threonylcarbamoyladenosine biosynthesis protein TsaE